MAKKEKAAKGKKSAKAKKADRLPREVGGVKIPKALRKDGEKLIALLKHPLVAEMAAAGLMAFAREMRGGKASAHAPADEARAARKDAGKALGELAQVAAILGTALAARTGGTRN
ncbi:hypothetical protein [Sphingomonas sp. LaA6.9]|uniref:hypothetical protein n=1 Tax=Sphingomonas sp. LaA6.9 TaxID=2919914 RepID=UPI001F502561|nr:hypothetical protein [Sphingomonas sp. LaA6.9]MCJ8156693.1 hypothetical protein [Sphingomonas sp. LaA6.9]